MVMRTGIFDFHVKTREKVPSDTRKGFALTLEGLYIVSLFVNVE